MTHLCARYTLSLWRTANTRKCQLFNSLWWPIYIFNLVDVTKLPTVGRLSVDWLSVDCVSTVKSLNVLYGWPENTDPRSVDPLTDPVHGLHYGPVHRPLLLTPPPPSYGPPQKIAEKENKQKWQKDLTYHLNGLTACVGENSNGHFRKINRLRRKVILIAYFAVVMYERRRKTCVLWR